MRTLLCILSGLFTLSLSAQPIKPTILTTNRSNPNQFGNNSGTASIKSGALLTNVVPLGTWDFGNGGILQFGSYSISNNFNGDGSLEFWDQGNGAGASFINGTWTGSFAGGGSGLTSLNASQLGSGTVPSARLSTFGTLTGTQIIVTGGPNWVGQTYMTNQLTATNTDATKVPFTIAMNGIGTNVWELRTNNVLMGWITNGTFYMPSFSGSNATFTGSTVAGSTNLFLTLGTTNSIVMTDTNGTTTTRLYSQSGTLYSSASPPQRTISVDEYNVLSGAQTTTGIDGKTTGATTLYTVPAGRQFILQHAYVIPTTVTSLTTPSTVSLGKTGATYIDVVAATALTGLIGTASSINLSPITGASVLQAGDVLKMNVSVGAIGTAYTFSVVVTGILL